ncbi:ADP-glyceromanno-heptose 6-epimerase [Aquabacter spiritensis]|uniref:ADP-L-glycero-D-manno-heptose-6-epimerase n=1 Tax=Aquabacter spiritensis TaxID=933073 RepID=A0A4R3M1K6_9HYPH|nr:ADP-glyceromanno-heptose 6-epimerase [Aquabacter spiritensis]TCT05037.1 ADP-glyceromanno-heptose 6-epimerase precursor [Aquabacter spiritensis]
MTNVGQLSGDDLLVVTGGAGFIGSNVARHFAQAGARVVVSDRFGTSTKWKNLVGVELHDLLAPDALGPFLARNADRIPLVIHMGAISSTTEADVDRIVRDNVRATLDLFDFCQANGTRLIYASSAATYGGGEQGFSDRSEAWYLRRLAPLNAYGWSKQLIDMRICKQMAQAAGPQCAGLKFFNVYGPGENHKGEMRSVVTKITPLIRAGETVELFKSYKEAYPDGGQKRDFVHVGDCVRVIDWLASHPDVSGLFNVGTGTARSFAELAAATFAALGQAPRIRYVDMPEILRGRYQYYTQADLSRLREAGYDGAMTSIEDGIAAYMRVWRPD